MSAAVVLLAEGVVREWTLTPGEVAWRLFLVIFFVVLNGFFVAAEFAVVKVRRSQLASAADDGKIGAMLAQQIRKRLDAYLSACQLGITLASLALGWLGEPFVAQMVEPLFVRLGFGDTSVHWVSFLLGFSLITFLHVVVGELMPKSLAIRKSLKTSMWVSRPLQWFYWLFRVPIVVLNGCANWLLEVVFRIDPVQEHEMAHSAEELRILVEETGKTDEMTEKEQEIMVNTLHLNDMPVREVMTPRLDVVTLDVDEDFEVNLDRAVKSRHTRFPLVKMHLDRPLGLIHVKDLLGLIREESPDLISIKRQMLEVPDVLPLDELLQKFLESQAHMALVRDEFGGASGIVMLDDVLEELVGEIQDEFDRADEEIEFRRLGPHEFVVDGIMSVRDLREATELKLDDAEVASVGGYITQLLGKVPETGDQAEIEGYEAVVTKSDGASVGEVWFRRLEAEGGGGDGEGDAAEEDESPPSGEGEDSERRLSA